MESKMMPVELIDKFDELGKGKAVNNKKKKLKRAYEKLSSLLKDPHSQ